MNKTFTASEVRECVAQWRKHALTVSEKFAAMVMLSAFSDRLEADERVQAQRTCSDERPCVNCFSGQGECLGPAPETIRQRQAIAQSGEWVMVPCEPTQYMIHAVCKIKLARLEALRDGRVGNPEGVASAVRQEWAALLATAPQLHPAEPVAWRTFDGEGNYDYRDYENNEHYRDWYVSRNGAKYANWVEPLYSHPASADAKRLEEQRDDAFQQAVQEARRVWMDEFPCEAGHDHVTPFDQFLYGNRPCMEAQPPANTERLAELLRGLEIGPMAATLSPKKLFAIGAAIAAQAKEAQPPAARVMVDAVMRVIDGQRRLPYCSIDEKQAFRNELEAAFAAQENPNG